MSAPDADARGPEFGLSERQKEDLITRQAAQIKQFQDAALDLLVTLRWLNNARQNGTGSAAIYAFLDTTVPAAIASAEERVKS